MRIPGIKNIACALASSMPADVELKAAAHQVPDISEVQFTPIAFIGEPVCDVESSNENNGSSSSVVLTFVTEHRLEYRRHAWIVQLENGETYLIGSRDSIPSFSCKDTSAGASTANHSETTIKLDSFCAWVSMGDVVPSDAEGSVIFDSWREITEEEVDQIINQLN